MSDGEYSTMFRVIIGPMNVARQAVYAAVDVAARKHMSKTLDKTLEQRFVDFLIDQIEDEVAMWHV